MNTQLTPQQMFDAARQLRGNKALARWFYEQVLIHPEKTPRDEFMVKLWFADQRRRSGEANKAREDMRALEAAIPEGLPDLDLSELWQAISTTAFALGEWKEAVEYQRKIMGLPGFNGFPVWKRIFHLESFLGLSLAFEAITTEGTEALKQYEFLRWDASLQGDDKNRADGMYLWFLGKVALDNRNYLTALELHKQARERVGIVRTETVLSISILHCLLKSELREHPLFDNSLAFYEQHKGELQTPDLLYINLEYQHVAHELGWEKTK